MNHGTPTLIHRGNTVELSFLDNGVALVKFDSQGAKVNLLSSAVMQELELVLGALEQELFTGAVFYSGKPDSFIAGADIKEIQLAQTLPANQVFQACQKGKDVLNRIACLPMPTAGAVHGRCLGGGNEMFMRFRHRLASASPKTVFGLPEVGLGVIPGWGGCVLLPHISGFKAAMSMILDPLHPWSASKAYKLGLVSELVNEDELLARSVDVVLGARTSPYRPSIMSRLSRSAFDSKAGRCLSSALARTFVKMKLGNQRDYPAPYVALKAMQAAFEMSPADAFAFESANFAMLAQSEGCKRGVQKFLDYQAAKKAKQS